MPRPAPLIHTKLHLPFIRPGLVSRPRLQEQIARGLRGPLTLVIAPAGFGKTTLVASCVTNRKMGVAWLSLDKNDNQTGRFLTYLVAALKSANTRIGAESTQLMAGMQQTPPEAVLTSLINDLDNDGVEVVLVLDDYQLIANQEIHENVTFLLDHCPNTFHLVITTRSDPPLPIARLRARGQMVEIRAADLRFTVSEAAKFLNDIMGLHLDADSVSLLEERTEGWITGLQMAALSMRDREDISGFIEGFSGTNRYILDYLLEEVLASQPPEVTHFLLYTSILERLTAPLCDFILDNNNEDENNDSELTSFHLLEHLERDNLFLISLDDERVWFRYHHLFADLLQARLQQTQPAVIPILHARAAAWLEQESLIPEAVQHFLASNKTDRAAYLIERCGPAHWAENDLSVIQMAENLPPEILLERPKIGVSWAWLLINQGLIEKALPLLNNLEKNLTGESSNPEWRWIRIIVRLALAFLDPRANPFGANTFPGEHVLEDIPPGELVLRDAADILYGMALARRGEIDQSAEFSVKAIQKGKKRHGMSTLSTLVPFLATLYLFQGRLHAADSLCREYLTLIHEKGARDPIAGNLDIILGNVLYEWNFLEEAESRIRDGLQANQLWRNIMTDAFGLVTLAHILKARGDYAGAIQAVEQFEARLQEQTRPVEFREDFHTLRMRVELAFGNLQAVSDWADRVRYSEDFHLHPEYYRRTLARISLAQGRYAAVEEILDGPIPTIPTDNRITQQLESDLLRAAALARQQRLPEALALLEACLALAEAEGYIRIFPDLGQPVRELLAAYLRTENPCYKTFSQKVLNVFSTLKGPASSDVQPVGLVEPLSDRELEVLRLIALGKTNQEIALQLVVARGTIKAHAASIYRKLEVGNRTEAVARARQLGILP